MLNVKTLTDTMSRMQLPQLQQYAALHKNDPYIVTLALSIANQKKQMMASKDGQAGMMPQPKVVDQELAQMAAPPPQQMAAAPQQGLPENSGIGQLPAQNMQGMAAGGIVAFEEGGDVRHFDGSRGSFIGTSSAVPSGAIIMGNMYQDPVTGQMKYLPGAEPQRTGYEGMSLGDMAGKVKDAFKNVGKNPSQYVTPTERQNIIAADQNKPTAQNYKPRRSDEQQFESDVAQRSGLPDPSATTVSIPGAGPVLPPAAAAAASSSEDDYMAGINKLLKGSQAGGGARTNLDAKRYDVTAPQLANATPKDMADRLAAAMGPNPTVSPFAAQQSEVNAANVASRQKYADDLAEQFKNQGEAFKGTLEKLTSKEARVKTMEDNQLGMSMFEAGIAMLSGESPHAMVNIGKGAQVGTKKYAEIQDKVESARDKIDDAKMKIEEFRRNEANMNAREVRLAKKDVNDAVSSGAQASLNLMREQYGLKHNEGLAFVNNSYMLEKFNVEQRTSANIHNQSTRAALDTAAANRASQEGISARSNATQLGLAALQAKMPPAEARTAMMLGTGKTDAERLESGLKKMQEVTSDKTGMAAVKLLTETNAKRETAMLPPLTMDELLRSAKEYQTLMYPKVVTDPGAKAPVYGRP
jgi:hypothetical protein